MRTASRRRRFMKFLRTARPRARGVVKPTRGPDGCWLASKNAVKRGPEYREPLSYTRRKSLDLSKRFFLGNGNCRVRSGRVTLSLRSGLRARRKQSTSSGPWRGGAREPAGRPWISCARGSHGSWRVCGYSVETYVLALLYVFQRFPVMSFRGRIRKRRTAPDVGYPERTSVARRGVGCQTAGGCGGCRTMRLDGTCYTAY